MHEHVTKIGGNRNFGWGKQMVWAGKQALRDRFGPGHYGTVASHADRWRSFCGWAREQGVLWESLAISLDRAGEGTRIDAIELREVGVEQYLLTPQ